MASFLPHLSVWSFRTGRNLYMWMHDVPYKPLFCILRRSCTWRRAMVKFYSGLSSERAEETCRQSRLPVKVMFSAATECFLHCSLLMIIGLTNPCILPSSVPELRVNYWCTQIIFHSQKFKFLLTWRSCCRAQQSGRRAVLQTEVDKTQQSSMHEGSILIGFVLGRL